MAEDQVKQFISRWCYCASLSVDFDGTMSKAGRYKYNLNSAIVSNSSDMEITARPVPTVGLSPLTTRVHVSD